MQTKFHHLTTDELLITMGEKRIHSPVIEELCQRLESPEWVLHNTEPVVECPVCAAKLEIAHVADGDLFTATAVE